MQARVKDITAFIESFAPSAWAEKWDNPGLQVGSLNQNVERLYLSVDPTLPALERAVQADAQLLVTHHPLIFQPQSRLDLDSPLGRILSFAIENRLSVYSAHTNLDIVQNGVSGALAEQLDLTIEGTLEESKTVSFSKLVVYVPLGREEEILNSVFKTGTQGSFTYPSFQCKGVHAKKSEEPSSKADLEREPVSKLEFQVPSVEISAILRQIKKLNISDGRSLEIIGLENLPHPIGYGVIGRLKRPLSFKGFAAFLKERLQLPYFQAAGTIPDKVQLVALCGGSGSGLVEKAFQAGVDIYITSELKHSQARLAQELNFCIFDIGHFYSEKFGIAAMGKYLREKLNKAGFEVGVIEDQEETGPLSLIK